MKMGLGSLIKAVFGVILLTIISFNATAASVWMEGNYVLTAISDNGTLGNGGTSYPGLRHDPLGTSDWTTGLGRYDYLTPGNPWEWFGVTSTQTGTRGNNNAGETTINRISGPTDVSSLYGYYDNHVTWAGQYSNYFTILHDYRFNDNNQCISISTTITALQNLSAVKFLRAIDPDPDSMAGGGASTTNYRGGSGEAPSDFVNSVGNRTGLQLGLYSNSSISHNTGVTNWTTDPNAYLSGTNYGTGDYTIGIAFDIGNMLANQSVTLDYSYVMNLPNEKVVPVPEPISLVMLGCLGAGMAGARKLRRKR